MKEAVVGGAVLCQGPDMSGVKGGTPALRSGLASWRWKRRNKLAWDE